MLSSLSHVIRYTPRSESKPGPPSGMETLANNKDHSSEDQDEGGEEDPRALIQVSGIKKQEKRVHYIFACADPKVFT